MNMIIKIAIVTILSVFSVAVYAQSCEQKFLQAQNQNIIGGFGLVNGIASLQVDRLVWAQIPYNVRKNIMTTFLCAVAGEGNSLAKAQLIDEGGLVLATWNMGSFEVKR